MQKNLFNIDFNDLWKRLINLATLKKQSWILQWNVNQISDGLLSPLTNRCRHSDMLKAAFVNVHRNFLDLQKELQNWPSFTALSQICYEPVKNNSMEGVVAPAREKFKFRVKGQARIIHLVLHVAHELKNLYTIYLVEQLTEFFSSCIPCNTEWMFLSSVSLWVMNLTYWLYARVDVGGHMY